MLGIMAMQLAAADVTQATRCDGNQIARFEREADLPHGALSAFGAPMADKDQPFQSSDIVSTPPLPIYRFVHAERQGCRLSITYEHGGRGHGVDQAILIAHGTAWRRINRLTYDKH